VKFELGWNKSFHRMCGISRFKRKVIQGGDLLVSEIAIQRSSFAKDERALQCELPSSGLTGSEHDLYPRKEEKFLARLIKTRIKAAVHHCVRFIRYVCKLSFPCSLFPGWDDPVV
jgi:hypothetical protein